ncbi:MAG: hypothetical protein HY505_03145 [Candidatus Yanofskybacteria bacterium]|nr:hypothetical protein [Candidatus Yanofskybacteria bacterium]
MRHIFYDLIDYKKGQSKIAKDAWQKGSYDHLLAKTEGRRCKRAGCNNVFTVKYYDPKQFCSHACSATHNNHTRGPMRPEVKFKISESIKRSPYHYTAKGKILVPRLVKNCLNCSKEFTTPRHQNHKYCSVNCSMKDIGSRPTSPKAARAKAGIRPDIGPNLYFFSRWEANFARILNLLEVRWIFQPKTFQLKKQKYTPDFYLPEYGSFVEIKNFLAEYSLKRDKEFRELYSEEKLVLILKEDYLKLQEEFSSHIENWEFS